MVDWVALSVICFAVIVAPDCTVIFSTLITRVAPPRAMVPMIVMVSLPSPPLMVSETVGPVKSVCSNELFRLRSRRPPVISSSTALSSLPLRVNSTSFAVPVATIGSMFE
ncbi:hypothetical protein GCM10027052_26760 [Parafrigoribacterium mesophilum]